MKYALFLGCNIPARLKQYESSSRAVLEELGVELVDLDDLLARADYVSCHTPLTDETRGIVGADAFGKMKKDAFLINCARGGVVDEDALLQALEAGEIAGAAVDVYSTEPAPADMPLLTQSAPSLALR